MASKQLTYDVMRSRDSATFIGSYQTLGSVLTYAASIFKIVNNSTVLVTLSIDGTNDHDILPANSFVLYDETANSPNTENVYMRAGTQFYVKGASGSGSVYLVVQYNKVIQQS